MWPLIRTRSGSSTSSTPSSTSSSPVTPSLSPSGWNPSRPTISPATVTPVTPEPAPEREYFTLTGKPALRASPPLLHPLELLSSSTPHRHTAYPSWPARACLGDDAALLASPAAYAFSGAGLPSSRISDEDLASLDFSCAPVSRHGSGADDAAFLDDGTAAAEQALGISWSDVGNGNVPAAAARLPDRPRRRLPPPPVPVRRRSSSRGVKRKSRAATLGVIAE